MSFKKGDEDKLRKQLEKLEWPALYMFSFIVPIDKLDEALALFLGQVTKTKISKKGNYASVSATSFMYTAEKVIEKYREAAKIEGIIAL